MNGALASTAARKAAQAVDIGYDYPGLFGGINSAANYSDLPGKATYIPDLTNATTGIAGYDYGDGGVGKNLKNVTGMGAAQWGDIGLMGLSLALKGLGGNDRSRSTSYSTSTLGPSTSSSWSPATESLIKMLDNLQSSWTKAGKV